MLRSSIPYIAYQQSYSNTVFQHNIMQNMFKFAFISLQQDVSF